MRQFKLLFSESIRSLGANLSTTIAATMTVLIGMFLLGLVIALGSWAQAFGDKQKEKLLVKVYFCTEITCAKAPRQADQRRRSKLDANPLVEKATFVTKAEALERMRKLRPDIVENLSANPLPHAFEVKAHDGANVKAISQSTPRRLRCRRASRRVRDGEEVSALVVNVAQVAVIRVRDRDDRPPRRRPRS